MCVGCIVCVDVWDVYMCVWYVYMWYMYEYMCGVSVVCLCDTHTSSSSALKFQTSRILQGILSTYLLIKYIDK